VIAENKSGDGSAFLSTGNIPCDVKLALRFLDGFGNRSRRSMA
jgi:hypothetical protein